MIVSHSHRLLFVHVQKTGGTSIDHLLRDLDIGAEPLKGLPATKHAKLRAALREHPELGDYFVFGFVRDPWARMWSWYSMVMRRKESAATNEWVADRLERNPFWTKVALEYSSFEEFVMRGTEEIPRLRTPQLDYLVAPGRRADFIGRTERLDDDVRAAMAAAGLGERAEGVLPPRRNAGPSTSHREHFTPAMVARVGEVFAPDVAEFGYAFDRDWALEED